MSFTSATPLRLLAMEAAIASVHPDDPDLLSLPRNLRNELEARRQANFGQFWTRLESPSGNFIFFTMNCPKLSSAIQPLSDPTFWRSEDLGWWGRRAKKEDDWMQK